LRFVIVLLAILAAPALLIAQEPAARRTAVSLSYGTFDYDLSGTGNTWMIAARVERPLTRVVLIEGGIVFARPEQQFGDTTTFVIPEVQAQIQIPRRLAPYLGAGIGLAMDFREEEFGGTLTEVTFSGAVGLRAWLTDRFGARAELRVRGIGTNFAGSVAELTVGAALKL
jgi:hypothetical protein